MTEIEAKINYQLNQYPVIKRAVKRFYQLTMCTIFPEKKNEGKIIRISPEDQNNEYFFGYYDKSPWDATDRYMLCLRVKNSYKSVAPKEPTEILLIDTENNNKYRVLSTTHTWNVQQGCMMQWLGPDCETKVIFNDFRDGHFCSVVLNVTSMQEKVLPMPIYSVAPDGSFALTLDFARLHRLRKGYGYSNIEESTKGQKLPDTPCIWRMDLVTGEVIPLIKYTDFATFEPRMDMYGAEHKVNHIMISPNSKRFMVLHRWFQKQKKYTRLVTCNCDGTDMYNLSDDDMVSHCCWKNDNEILAFEHKKKGGPGYYLMRDKSSEYLRKWEQLHSDGHPSYSPDGRWVVTDTYPDRTRMASVMLIDNDHIETIARVFTPFQYDNNVRCDLHPRWSRKGDKICVDAVFEGRRGLYVLPCEERLRE